MPEPAPASRSASTVPGRFPGGIRAQFALVTGLTGIVFALLLTSALQGLPVAEARAFDEGRLLGLLGGPLRPARVACALLALTALREGLKARVGGAR